EDDSAELDAIISELRDFKIQFEECSKLSLLPSTSSSLIIKRSSKMNSPLNHSSPLLPTQPSSPPLLSSATTTTTTTSSSTTNTNGCVYELRTLEDQLEAALASLTLTINDCTTTDLDVQQQRSSGSSACSSGLGDEIVNDSFNHYNNISNTNNPITTSLPPSAPATVSFAAKFTAMNMTDDCDSAFSDSGSTDKITSSNHDEPITCRSMVTMTSTTKQTTSFVADSDDPIPSPSQHPSKLLIRTYNDDGSTKSILIDHSMTIRDVLFVLVHKNHREPDNDYALVEILPDLHMERTFEDHQKLTEAILMWPTTSSNRLIFTKRPEKYSLFRATTSLLGNNDTTMIYDELLKTPDIEGVIHLKEKSRKSWKKHFCVLRSSGLYFVPKGKSKKDLVCLAKFENIELFFGLGWKKKFKSPSDYCFALKHPLIQKKSSKYIKYMCVDTKNEFDQWTTSIRIAKFGQQLKINHFLIEKAMNIYRSSGRFAAVCSAQLKTPEEQLTNSTNAEICFPPKPCASIRDRQVLNRIPIASTNNTSYNQYHSPQSSVSPQLTSSTTIISTSIISNEGNHKDQQEDDHNDENSPIKSASYMDELRQRLERVLNDPPSPIPSVSSPAQSQNSLNSLERHSGLPISKSFRLPVPSIPTQALSSVSNRSTAVPRIPLKSTPLSIPTSSNPPVSSLTKSTTIRTPTTALIAPPKLKPTPSTQCLSSTENIRTMHTNPQMTATTTGSTPLPRKQLTPIQVSARNLSYRLTNNSNTTGHQSHLTNGNYHQLQQQQQQQQQHMSKSFIMPSKRADHRSVSSLSVTSKSDSLNLDDSDFPLPSPTFLDGLSDTSISTKSIPTTLTKSKPTVVSTMNFNRSKLPSSTNITALKKPSTTFRANGRPQPPVPGKSGLVPPSIKLSTSVSLARPLNKSLVSSTSNNSLTNGKISTILSTTKPVPPVPPRKSSIPRPSFKPQPPQRDSSNNLLQKPHISHL
ncbi:unnamed protein product, partial [Adineta ricciae]